MTRSIPALISGAALALGLTASPARAKDCPPGLAKQGKCSAEGPAHPGKAHGKAEATKPAKAETPRDKPDHAGKAAVDDPRLSRDGIVEVGSVLGAARYHLITDPLRFGLDPAPVGSGYYIVGDRIVRADSKGFEILDVIRPLDARDCPPGLAKKEPACIPPGQVDKILRSGWDAERYVKIDDLDRYDLTAPDGDWDYYVVDDTIVRVDRTTRDILGVVRLIEALN